MNRLIYVVQDLSKYGAQTVLIDYANKFLQHNYSVTISVFYKNFDYMPDPKINVLYLAAKKFENIRFVRFIIKYFYLLRYLSANKNANIISVAPFLNRILSISKKIGLIKNNLIIEEHVFPPEFYKDEIKNPIVRNLYRKTEFFYKYADKIRVLSEEARSYFCKKYKSNKFIFMPNFMDFTKIEESLSNCQVSNEKGYLCYIGRFVSQKNISFLIKSFKYLSEIKDINLKIIGFGPEEKELRSLSASLNLENRIQFIKSSEQNFCILKNSIGFPMVSLWEAMPLIMIESMYIGTPVISKNFNTGPSYLIGKNERGAVFDTNSPKIFSQFIAEYLKDKRRLKQNTKKAHNFVKTNLDIDKNFTKYINEFFN